MLWVSINYELSLFYFLVINKFTNVAATTGECVYFGCVNDLCRIRDSIIEHNYCHDTFGSSGGSRAGFQVKSGSYNVVGPCIIVYDDYDCGRNLIDGNLNDQYWNNLAGIGVIQNSINPTIKYTRNITISGNTVYMSRSDACLRLNGVANKNITISNNVLYCGHQLSTKATNDLTGASMYNNAVNGTISATGIQPDGILAMFRNVFVNTSANNLYPTVGSPFINKGTNRLYQVLYDYNDIGRSMSTPTTGAYKYSTTNNSGGMTTIDFKCGSSTAAVPQYPLIR
ncbi:unnamed protein product [Rotaria socialis]|uniref:Uncharacterized protein n=1 Tax=Rotaria socialis TaxID=392032 RepID=A0A817TAA7_9BILA|nr:unnamed protein product [Rotaria socialis]CAF3474317.1 unnamed protein product [Rotaria socialis]